MDKESKETKTLQLEVLRVEYHLIVWSGGGVSCVGQFTDPAIAEAQFEAEYCFLEEFGEPFDLALDTVCTTKLKRGGKSQLLVAEKISLH